MRVIFRKFPEGDVVALLPECEANPGQVVCYQHVGQHGEADRNIAQWTLPATEAEYASLLRELHAIGYEDLRVAKRMRFRRALG